jgi:hypothetical protein
MKVAIWTSMSSGEGYTKGKGFTYYHDHCYEDDVREMHENATAEEIEYRAYNPAFTETSNGAAVCGYCGKGIDFGK